MKLINILSQYRRDFQGEYKCEFCGHIERDEGMSSYDDRNFHDNVIPNMECPKCGKSTKSENGVVDYYETKYPEGWQV